MNNARKQTIALFVALLAGIVGSWGRIVYELKSLSAWQRYLIGVLFVLILTLILAWIITPQIFKTWQTNKT